MENGSQLYILMNGPNYECELYRINDPQSDTDRDESSIEGLGDPLLTMAKTTFPEFMSFAAIDSRIYMVGGSVTVDSGEYLASNKVFIYDTASSTWVSGPPMNAGKHSPYLITLGSKLFALSTLLNFWGLDNSDWDASPRFEMLDIENLGRGWSPLPMTPLNSSKIIYGSFACAAMNGFIFASIGGFGTWAFDVKKVEWSQVSVDLLPFSGQAAPMPNVPDLCCGYSLKLDRYCAFRFSYQSNSKDFEIVEIPIDDSYTHTPLEPSLVCCRGCPVVFGPDGRVYFVSSGVDKAESYDSAPGNRYVHVYALDMNPIETTKIDSVLRRCSHTITTPKKKRRKLMRFEEGNKDEDEGKKEIKLNGLWRRSFSGGPADNSYLQVVAAFAI